MDSRSRSRCLQLIPLLVPQRIGDQHERPSLALTHFSLTVTATNQQLAGDDQQVRSGPGRGQQARVPRSGAAGPDATRPRSAGQAPK